MTALVGGRTKASSSPIGGGHEEPVHQRVEAEPEYHDEVKHVVDGVLAKCRSQGRGF